MLKRRITRSPAIICQSQKSTSAAIVSSPPNRTHHKSRLTEIVVQVHLSDSLPSVPLRVHDSGIDSVDDSENCHPDCEELVREPEVLVVDAREELHDSVPTGKSEEEGELSDGDVAAAKGGRVCAGPRCQFVVRGKGTILTEMVIQSGFLPDVDDCAVLRVKE